MMLQGEFSQIWWWHLERYIWDPYRQQHLKASMILKMQKAALKTCSSSSWLALHPKIQNLLNNQTVSNNFVDKNTQFFCYCYCYYYCCCCLLSAPNMLKQETTQVSQPFQDCQLKMITQCYHSFHIPDRREGSFKTVMGTKNRKTMYMAPFLNLASDHPEILQDKINCICICNMRDYNHHTSIS
jgi:hypothetical protein